MPPASTSARRYLYAIAAAFVGIGLLHGPAAGEPAGAAAKLQFTGNAAISSDRLRAALSMHPLFDRTGTIDLQVLEHDLLLLNAYYWDHGHATVKIGEPVIPPTRDAVTIPIEEGPVFKIGPVAVTGEVLGTAKANLARMRVRPGATFSRTMIANDREALSNHYQDQGYASVNVVPITKIDLARRTIGLTFEIERGKRSSFERIEIYGNAKIPTRTIQRALGIAEGDPFTNVDLVEGKRRIEALGVEQVAFSIKRGSSDELVVLTVEVIE